MKQWNKNKQMLSCVSHITFRRKEKSAKIRHSEIRQEADESLHPHTLERTENKRQAKCFQNIVC